MNRQDKTDHPFKNTRRVPLGMRLFFLGATLTFKVLGVVSPRLAGKLALRLFMTPPKFGTPKREEKLRESATLTFYNINNRNISVRSWGKGPAVLLSHGWGGRCTQLGAFIEPLVAAGYRVIGFDIPGHGDSSGKKTNMLDVANIIANISAQEGPFKAIIGHSFGSGTALLSLDRHDIEAEKIVLVSCFSDVMWITEIFGEVFSMRKSTLEAMRKIAMEKFAHTYGSAWKWDDLSPQHTIRNVTGDVLLVHDEKDHEVPYNHALHLHKVAPQATLLTTSGYGHRKILMNRRCVEAAVDFIGSP